MKKLCTFLCLLFFSTLAFSQEKALAKGLHVYNETKCIQFFLVSWVKDCNCGYSTEGGSNDIIKIKPGEQIDVYTYLNQDGNHIVPEYAHIVAAKVGGGYYCTGSSPVGQPCSNHPLTAQYMEYVKYGEDCKECTQTLATWKPGDCKNPATLTFTNP